MTNYITTLCLLLTLLAFSLSNEVKAQDAGEPILELSNYNAYAEAGFHYLGQGSINIERKFKTTDKLTWYARLGYAVAGEAFGDEAQGMLAAVTMLTGEGNNHLEVNGGFFIGKDTYDKSTITYPVLDLGYRYQKPGSSFIFKAKAGWLGVGIALGYGF